MPAILATHLVGEARRKVRFMYREQPDDESDTGWRMFSGDEDQDYVDDPANLGWYEIATILEIDADVEPFLDAPIGSVFERESSDDPFEEVYDFDFGDTAA